MMKKSSFIISVVAMCLCAVLIAVVVILYPFGGNSQTQEADRNVKLLTFSQDTYKSSIQFDAIKIDWTKYPTLPSNISLNRTFLHDDPYFMIHAPEWNEYLYDTTVVFYDEPVYIAFTVQESRRPLLDKTIENLSNVEPLIKFHETEGEIIQIGNFEIQKSVGTCTAQTDIIELRQYVSYTFHDESLQYCFIGISPYTSNTTAVHLVEAIEEMIQSIGFDSLAGEMEE